MPPHAAGAPNATSARNTNQPRSIAVTRKKPAKLRNFRLCTKISALVRFLSVPIGGTVSSPARFHSPTEDDLREFIDPSLTLFCIVDADGYFNHVKPAW
jgi:hypothetical protein